MNINLDSFDNQMFIDEMVSAGQRVVCERNQAIYDKGTRAEYLYLLEQGRIELIDDATVHFLFAHRGDMFGWSSLDRNGMHMTTAFSRTISSVIQIPSGAVNTILERYQDTAAELYERLENHCGSKRCT